MSVLYDLKAKIEKAIVDKKLDAGVVRGKIALQAGFLVSLITPTSPDDPAKIDKLRKAAESVIQLKL